MRLLTSLVFVLHDLCSDRLSTSLHTLHVTLDMSYLLRCTHFMLRWIRLVYFVAHTSCYVGTSSLLRCTHFMLRWIRLVYFVAHTSCYVGYVLSTLLHTLHVTLDTSSLRRCTHTVLHVTLDTSSLLRCTHFMLRWICLVYFVPAHTGTMDNCWKACKKMLPSSLSGQSQ